jgi:hypothetical protein
MLICVLDECGWKLNLCQLTRNFNSSTSAHGLKTKNYATFQIVFRLSTVDRVCYFLHFNQSTCRQLFSVSARELFVFLVGDLLWFIFEFCRLSLKQRSKISNRSEGEFQRCWSTAGGGDIFTARMLLLLTSATRSPLHSLPLSHIASWEHGMHATLLPLDLHMLTCYGKSCEYVLAVRSLPFYAPNRAWNSTELKIS